ncbi:exostosin glycosyltransferase 1 ttv isoform X2 [Arctopsyche grandis]|uniref:exostosin glycosyltransferase 1 ttv isoform X2 n=1 Tax=Arctopsyche grandis TaxID=121162 RepID=UPI00406D9E81
MQAKKRYLLLVASCAFLACAYFGGYRARGAGGRASGEGAAGARAFWRGGAEEEERGRRRRPSLRPLSPASCRMDTCFEASKCRGELAVYVYPSEGPASPSYRKVLSALRQSRYATDDPSRACLFVLGIDTLDRDPLSPDFVHNVPQRLQRLPFWNGGRNHVVFNLYSGTWPEYSEEGLGFDAGYAILARASASVSRFRPLFDISLPLFHKQHPEKGGEPGAAVDNNFPADKRYLLAFKGKRYVHGIGSETRNSLWHLHNERDLVLVTTCRHGKSWRNMKDERCDEDNREYDRYEYEVLLQNSTFCLVPRGRRLGSFRFLEVLQAGCVPVLLSNSWRLPFSSVIDWNKAVLWADERLLLQVPELVRSVGAARILAMRQQTQLLWEQYFSSIEKIVFTTLEIIAERIPGRARRDALAWNSAPGALVTLPQYADTRDAYPFWLEAMGTSPPGPNAFTALIYCQLGAPTHPTSPLYRLIKNISRSRYIHRILIMWANDRPPPPRSRWPSTPYSVPLDIIDASVYSPGMGISARFQPHALIETAAVLQLDEDASLTADEADFAYTVWKDFPDRIVGYPARTHFWDDAKGAWGYTSRWTNEYSIVLTGAAVYHRYYHDLYTRWLPPLLHKAVAQTNNCEDILMNCLVAHVTRRPPLKLTQRKQYKERNLGRSPWNDPDHFIQRQSCLNTFAAVFGYMPLVRSRVRLDPMLFKDPVSNLRKKYRQIELVGS